MMWSKAATWSFQKGALKTCCWVTIAKGGVDEDDRRVLERNYREVPWRCFLVAVTCMGVLVWRLLWPMVVSCPRNYWRVICLMGCESKGRS
jgi:hypothetical protein